MANYFYNEVVMQWGDTEYTVRPTFALCKRVQSKGVNIFANLKAIQEQEPLIFDLAIVVSEFLKAAGADVSQDEVLHVALMEDPEAVIGIAGEVFMSMIPQKADSAGKPGKKTKK